MSRPSGPICVPCKVAMRPTKNDASLEWITTDGKTGLFHSYELWMADEWTCPKCGHAVLTGFAEQPMSQYWQPNHLATVEQWPNRIQVK